MDVMFRRWVRLPTILALVKPKYGYGPVQIRFFTEDETTKKHYPWLATNEHPLSGEKIFTLHGTSYEGFSGTLRDKELVELAENFVGKNISIDRWCQNESMSCFLIEVKEK